MLLSALRQTHHCNSGEKDTEKELMTQYILNLLVTCKLNNYLTCDREKMSANEKGRKDTL